MSNQNHRTYKKLCRKAAEIMQFENCHADQGDGIYYRQFNCGGFHDEWDSEDCWPYLLNAFHFDNNMEPDPDLGVRMKPDHRRNKATPKNVLAWGRLAFAGVKV